MQTTLEDINRAHALGDRSAAFIITSLLHKELQVIGDDPVHVRNLGKHLPRGPLALATKAAVAPATTTDASWAGPLAPNSPEAQAFLGFSERSAVLPRLGAVSVRGNTTAVLQTGNAQASWTGQANAKPLRSLAFAASNLVPRGLNVLVAVSAEVAKLGVPDALGVVERSLSLAMTNALDLAVLDPSSTEISGVRPASLTAGLSPITPAGDVSANIGQLLGALSGGSPSRPVLIASQATAARLLAIRDLEAAGIRVLTSANVPAGRLIAVDADAVLVADTGVELMRTEHASLQMDDAPANPTTSTTVLVNLWQRDLVALKIRRYVNWLRRSDGAAFMNLS